MCKYNTILENKRYATLIFGRECRHHYMNELDKVTSIDELNILPENYEDEFLILEINNGQSIMFINPQFFENNINSDEIRVAMYEDNVVRNYIFFKSNILWIRKETKENQEYRNKYIELCITLTE